MIMLNREEAICFVSFVVGRCDNCYCIPRDLHPLARVKELILQ